jgi:hypothetical protein
MIVVSTLSISIVLIPAPNEENSTTSGVSSQ